MPEVKETILIADDEENLGDLVEILLRQKFKSKYDYGHVTLGSSAESMLCKCNGNIALGILDNDMKVGPTGSEIIKNYAKKIKTPLILYYAAVDEEEKIGKQALDDGARAYVNKFTDKSLEILVEKVEEILNEREK